MRVALVHYWLVGMRGGEKVLEEFCRMWPEADIFTHVYDPDAVSDTIKQHKIITTFVHRLPASRRLYKKYLLFMPMALEALDLSAYDLVISSESGPAKGVLVRPDALHICYCHSPMRYIWDQYPFYSARAGLLTRWALKVFLPFLRMWDVSSAARVDHFIANSAFVARRISKFYRRDAEVVHPPVNLERFSPSSEVKDYYFAFGQLVGYKRFDLAVEAFNRLGSPLIIVGDGEELGRLKSLARSNITFLGWQSDEEIARLLRHCRALIFPGVEDFGIAPLEAMASGRPVIGYGAGGVLETVVDGVTGKLFFKPSAEALAGAVVGLEESMDSFESSVIRAHAEKFAPARFANQVRASIARQFDKPRVRSQLQVQQLEAELRWNLGDDLIRRR
ncbi:MAG: glycosyltransferase [Methylovirgula sp.]